MISAVPQPEVSRRPPSDDLVLGREKPICEGMGCGLESRPGQKSAPTPPVRPREISDSGQQGKSASGNSGAGSKVQEQVRAATESARDTTPKEPSGASGDASGDLQNCESAYSAAARCFNNPRACVGEMSSADQQRYANMENLQRQASSGNTQGLSNLCSQMQNTGGSSREISSGLAGVLTSKQTSCSVVCSRLAQKYQSLLNNCNGCDSEYIYRNAYDTLSANQNRCDNFSHQAQSVANQAIEGAGAGSYGNLCNQLANANPQSWGNNAANPAMGAPNLGESLNCAMTPQAPACQNLARKEAMGSAQFAESSAKQGDFNLPESDTGPFEKSVSGYSTENSAAAPRGATIPNNSGGGIPGAGNQTSARLDSGGGRPSAGSPGYSTDVLQGTQSGNGYSAPVSANSGGDSYETQYAGQQQGTRDEGNGGLLGMDLRQYLPGGSRYPMRRLAGFGARSEINAKEEDLFRRISTKMYEKCRLGILMGCG